MRLLIATVVGFLASALLYHRTHAAGFPELARYALGGVVVLLAFAVLHPGDDAGLRRLLLALACSGLGVSAARLWEMIT